MKGQLAAVHIAHALSDGYQWIIEGQAVKRAAIPNRVPAPGNGVVVGRVLAAAVCRSDIKELYGARSGLRTFGHELVMEVLAAWAPPGRSYAFACGDRVILNPHPKIERSSGFGTHLHAVGDVAELDRSLVPLPPSVDTLRGVFVEPLACAISCVRVASAALDGTGDVLVNGSGLMGVLIASILAAKGHSVVLTNRSAHRLGWASTVADPEVQVLSRAQATVQQYDLIIEASALYDEDTCALLSDRLRSNGRFHVFAGTDARSEYRGVSVDDIRRNELVRVVENGPWRFSLTGSHRVRAEDFTESIRLIATDALSVNYESLVTRHVALDDLPEAFVEDGVGGRTLVLPRLATVRSGT